MSVKVKVSVLKAVLVVDQLDCRLTSVNISRA